MVIMIMQETRRQRRFWTNIQRKNEINNTKFLQGPAMGLSFEPQFSKCRIGLSKFTCLLTEIGDMHLDIDERELFTDVLRRYIISVEMIYVHPSPISPLVHIFQRCVQFTGE